MAKGPSDAVPNLDPKAAAKAAREARLAAALRANLKKRKAAAAASPKPGGKLPPGRP